jgi:Phosphoribosylanthranilate isomerase
MIVKICGLTNLEDALVALEAGADLLGFVLYPKSPRAVSLTAVAEIGHALRRAPAFRQRRPALVGVFVNAPPTEVAHALDEAGLDLAQLSGHEPPDDLRALGGRAYKAVRSQAEADALPTVDAPPAHPHRPDLLLDAMHPMLYGGSGQRADESLALRLARRCRLLLAGGLTPDNVAEVIGVVQPWGVDVASGVEAAPGKKDHRKLRSFVASARAALRAGGDFQSWQAA